MPGPNYFENLFPYKEYAGPVLMPEIDGTEIRHF